MCFCELKCWPCLLVVLPRDAGWLLLGASKAIFSPGWTSPVSSACPQKEALQSPTRPQSLAELTPAHHPLPFIWKDQNWAQDCRHSLTTGEQWGSSLDLLTTQSLTQPWWHLATFAARAHCQIMPACTHWHRQVHLGRAASPSSWASVCPYRRLLFPKCRMWHSSMLNFRTFLLANSFSVSRCLWMADLLSHYWTVQPFGVISMGGCETWQVPTHACCTPLVTGHQVQDGSFPLPLEPNYPSSFWTPGAHPSKLIWMQEYHRRQCQKPCNVQVNTIHWRKVFLESSMIVLVTKVRLTGLYSPRYAFGLFWRWVQNLLSSRS